jgi:hypothetical protein
MTNGMFTSGGMKRPGATQATRLGEERSAVRNGVFVGANGWVSSKEGFLATDQSRVWQGNGGA